MNGGITVKILGDFGPFSRMGKSIGYRVEIRGESYLIDCGAPLFQQIGGHGLKNISGVFITHCHDDHKRWLTDLALFNMYAPDMGEKVRLYTTEEIHEDIIRSSLPSLEKSLSADSLRIVDLPYSAYIDHRPLGRRARFHIAREELAPGVEKLCIMENSGRFPRPDEAKIVINPATGSARMLLRDPDYGEWVEPESFYAAESKFFYEGENRVFRGDGFVIEAITDPLWHGVKSMGIKISTGSETLIFSSDTVNDPALWKRLCSEKRPIKTNMSKSEFDGASIIVGDINDFIERTWSRERYESALSAFDGAVVIHDISVRNSVVHTDYEKLPSTALRKESTILTHCPDRMTSEWVLCNAGKTYHMDGNDFFEVVGDRRYPLNADIYHKEGGRFFVGFRSENGSHTVYEKDGLLRLESHDGLHPGKALYAVDLYEDISGRYYPMISKDKAAYIERPDGEVELVEINENGSTGRKIRNVREEVQKAHVGS